MPAVCKFPTSRAALAGESIQSPVFFPVAKRGETDRAIAFGLSESGVHRATIRARAAANICYT